MAINLDKIAPARLTLPGGAEHFTLTANKLESKSVKLNERALRVVAYR